MKVVKTDSSCVNLDNYDKVEIRDSLGLIGGYVTGTLTESNETKDFDAIAVRSYNGLFGRGVEKEVLGRYIGRGRATEVCSELAKAWINNISTFNMPIDA